MLGEPRSCCTSFCALQIVRSIRCLPATKPTHFAETYHDLVSTMRQREDSSNLAVFSYRLCIDPSPVPLVDVTAYLC